MKQHTLLFAVLIFCCCIASLANAGSFKAGVSKKDVTLPIGAPLAGLNHGDRIYKHFPLPHLGQQYTTFLNPSEGVLDPTWCKALIVTDGETDIAWVTLDAIGMDGSLAALAYNLAVNMGFNLPRSNVIFSGSHTHSGPGAISPQFLWAIAPALDLMIPELQQQLANNIALTMIEAQNGMVNAMIGIGQGQLTNVTKNRRAGMGILKENTIDPNLGVFRIDDLQGNPLATVWNFAIHGICYGSSNMKFSSDIMGYSSDLIEQNVGGIALFINADAGDIDPADGMCDNAPTFTGSPIIAEAVQNVRNGLATTSDDVLFKAYADDSEFGLANINFTLARFDNCTEGGIGNICTICRVLDCTIPVRLNNAWLENDPYFSAFLLQVQGVNNIMVSVPGEALVELGWEIYNTTKDLGFNLTFIAGYSNNHLGYFATPDQYVLGGYESQMTFWGIETSSLVLDGVTQVATVLKP